MANEPLSCNYSTFAYVILQYGHFDLTVSCVDSIRECTSSNAKIVVVDNCSPDDSLELLEKKFGNDSNIKVIATQENLGFSKGNNLGFSLAKKEWNPSFIVVLNSDIELTQPTFESKIEAAYNDSRFGVLGPDIYIPSRKRHQNPFAICDDALHPNDPSIQGVEEARSSLLNELNGVTNQELAELTKKELFKSSFVGNFLVELKHQIQDLKHEVRFRHEYKSRVNDVALQGACFVFSRQFIQRFELPFTPETFLYCEEMLLRINCKEANLLMVFDPSIKVLHFEGSSTDSIDSVSKKKFINREILKSLDVVERRLATDSNNTGKNRQRIINEC